MMAPGKKSGKPKQPESILPLSEQAHNQIMDYLRLADKTAHPAIREKALKLADRKSKYEQRQKARVPPALILSANIVLAVAVVLGSWYAFLHYSQALAWELSAISILIFLVVAGISLFLAGRLSEGRLMTIFGWLGSHVKERLKPFSSSSESATQGPTDGDK